MTSFKGQFTSISGLSDVRRLPRLGKIRLGLKVKSMKDPSKEYPKETPYFVCPEEVEKVYGDKPTSIKVMLPLNDREACFPQALKWYGNSRGLKCIGNGVVARRAQEDGTTIEMECPCNKLKTDENPKGECTRRATLFVMLPEVSLGGVYQIDTSSYHSIVDVNSGIDMILAMTSLHMGMPRVGMLPLVLRRVPRTTHGAGQKSEHYTLQITLDLNMESLEKLKMEYKPTSRTKYLLPPAEEINPEKDPDARVIFEDDDDKTIDAQAEPAAANGDKSTEQLWEEAGGSGESEELPLGTKGQEQNASPRTSGSSSALAGLLSNIEAKIRESGFNRMLFLQYLLEGNYIEKRNELAYLPSLKQSDAEHFLENWKAVTARFNGWMSAKGKK